MSDAVDACLRICDEEITGWELAAHKTGEGMTSQINAVKLVRDRIERLGAEARNIWPSSVPSPKRCG